MSLARVAGGTGAYLWRLLLQLLFLFLHSHPPLRLSRQCHEDFPIQQLTSSNFSFYSPLKGPCFARVNRGVQFVAYSEYSGCPSGPAEFPPPAEVVCLELPPLATFETGFCPPTSAAPFVEESTSAAICPKNPEYGACVVAPTDGPAACTVGESPETGETPES